MRRLLAKAGRLALLSGPVRPALTAVIVVLGAYGVDYLLRWQGVSRAVRTQVELVAWLVAAVLLFVAVKNVREWYRGYRWRRGRYTVDERRQLDRHRQAQQGWDAAKALRRTILTGQALPVCLPPDIARGPGTHIHYDVPVQYARFYGTTVTYQTNSVVAMGRPSFVFGALAVSAFSNAGARRRAEVMSMPQWREHRTARVLITSEGLMIHNGAQWLRFDYGAMVALYPDPENWAFVCEFSGSEPLMLRGEFAPLAAVISVYATQGVDGVLGHPAFQCLNL